VINVVLSTLIIKLVDWIGLPTQSERLTTITTGIFIAQFFNTGFLLFLVNFNATEHKNWPEWITSIFATGKFAGFVPDWYNEVGSKIVVTMIINAFVPYGNVFAAVGVPKIMQYLDSKGDVYKTKKPTMGQFKATYAGGDYVIHFKYAVLLNTVFVTMLYGSSMPILFPIAALSILN
jgi:hypothetical protein